MFWWTMHARTILTTLVALACLFYGRQDAPESELYAAAVSGMRAELRKQSRFDASPVRIPNDVGYPGPSDYYTDATTETATRRKVLEKLNLDTVRAFPLLRDCDPLLYPPGDKVTRGCPDHRIDIVFDRIRRSPQQSRWLMRKMEIGYSKAGRSGLISEMIIARRGDKYVLVRDSILIHID